MSPLGSRRPKPPIRVERGERLLADAAAREAHLGGTRDAFYMVRRTGSTFRVEETVRIPWEQIQAAEWNSESDTLVVSEVGTWGEAWPEHRYTVEEPGRLLELVRERVTASIVYQRHVQVEDRRGLRVIARRAPHGRQPLTWIYEFDEGVDPDDPAVRAAAAEALAAAQIDVGLA